MEMKHVVAFGEALAKGDLAAAFAHVSDHVVLRSPIFEDPFTGKAEVARTLGIVKSVIGKTEPAGMAVGEDRLVKFSKLEINGIAADGVEVIQVDEQGLIDRITVYWRPFRAAVEGHNHLAPALGRPRIT